MKIGIQTWGSEGDIRPFVALGAALAKRGHAVELLYTEIGERRYDEVAASLGFTARAVASPVVADPERVFEIGLKVINTRNQLQQGLIISRELLEPIVEPAYEAGLELARRSDLFIHHFIFHPARAAADKAGTPQITVTFAHMLTPSRFIHPPETPRLGEWGNVLEWKIAAFALNHTLLKDANRFRSRVGLAPFEDLMRDGWPSHLLNLLASSPAFLDPRPADWPAWHQLCGFLELPSHEHESVSPDVERFLASGAAPVFMGFGSLMPTEGEHLESHGGDVRRSGADRRLPRDRASGDRSRRSRTIASCSSGARRTSSSSLDARPSSITAARGRRTRRFAPARRRFRWRTCPISSRGPKSCGGSARRRRCCAGQHGMRRSWRHAYAK